MKNADILRVRKMYWRVRQVVTPEVLDKLRAAKVTETTKRLTVASIAMQNLLRDVMMVCLEQELPYDQRLLMEIACRMAAYAITAAPPQDHAAMLERVRDTLPTYVASKMREGAIIHTEWEMGEPGSGVIQKNTEGMN